MRDRDWRQIEWLTEDSLLALIAIATGDYLPASTYGRAHLISIVKELFKSGDLSVRDWLEDWSLQLSCLV
jgi:hypothetical protein